MHSLIFKQIKPSIDLYFKPQTIPDKGWFAYIRIYEPEQAAFDGSWKPGDFEEVK